MIVQNETKGPIKVPLGKGKFLHLGLNQSGHVLPAGIEHPGFKKMVERGEISVQSEADVPGTGTDGRTETGQQPARIQRKGLA